MTETNGEKALVLKRQKNKGWILKKNKDIVSLHAGILFISYFLSFLKYLLPSVYILFITTSYYYLIILWEHQNHKVCTGWLNGRIMTEK